MSERKKEKEIPEPTPEQPAETVPVGTLTRHEIDKGLAYVIREGQRYEVYPGGYVKLKKPTIALGRMADLVYKDAALDSYEINKQQVLLTCELEDGFDWETMENEGDPVTLRRAVSDFLLVSLGRPVRPGVS